MTDRGSLRAVAAGLLLLGAVAVLRLIPAPDLRLEAAVSTTEVRVAISVFG